ncbi:MAG TPA: MFS transporter, partial [Terriglobales bacterium]
GAGMQSVIIGCTNLFFTVIAMSIIDMVGRKKLLLFGTAGVCIFLASIGWIFRTGGHQHLLIWLVMTFMGFFAISQGAVIWVYISEVFPNRVRAKGQSLGSFTHWICAALISLGFPQIAKWSKSLPFVFFAAITVVQFFVVLFAYPETKGVTLEEIQKEMSVA